MSGIHLETKPSNFLDSMTGKEKVMKVFGEMPLMMTLIISACLVMKYWSLHPKIVTVLLDTSDDDIFD